MEVIIKTKGLSIKSCPTEFIEEKLKGLEKLMPQNIGEKIEVEVGKVSAHHNKGNIYRAEIYVEMPKGALLRAVSEKENIRTAVLDAKKEFEIQLKKYKEKPMAEMNRSRQAEEFE
ncbi:MAG: HPF/RaiA family ribosome-associated protein [Candidatus Pacebacteria bacterium]|nr:HPF/RaiA family ribosome-associated protein [Candidatus Paceibacterota bacterium]